MTTETKDYALAETKRHKPCLIYRGYRYVQDKIQNRTIYWRCEDRAHCNGRAHQLVNNDSLPVLTIKHNHVPLMEDLSRHDIISVDSHRRRRRRQLRNTHSNQTSKSNEMSQRVDDNGNKCVGVVVMKEKKTCLILFCLFPIETNSSRNKRMSVQKICCTLPFHREPFRRFSFPNSPEEISSSFIVFLGKFVTFSLITVIDI